MIHSNHEVKPHRARLVLPWGTRWEARVTNVFTTEHLKDHFLKTLRKNIFPPANRLILLENDFLPHLKLKLVFFCL